MSTLPPQKNQYLEHLMLDVKNMRVKHVRKMFVLLREMGTDLHLEDMEHKTNWSEFEEFNKRLQLLVVQHGLTLGEFATGYVLNVQNRQRTGPSTPPTTPKKRKATPAATTSATASTFAATTEPPRKKKAVAKKK